MLRDATETSLAALTIFTCIPAVTVPWLGLLGRLSLTGLLMTSGALQLLLLVIIPETPTARPSAENSRERWSPIARYAFFLSILGFGIMLLNSLRYTPCDSDSLWYHLPMVAEWIRNHSIRPSASIPLMARAYPGAREAILTWLSMPLTSENLALFFLAEVPALFAALYAICRQFQISEAVSLSMAGLFLLGPEIAAQAYTQKNDLFFALTFLLTLLFMVRWLRTGLLRYCVPAGLAGGLLCATKFSGPVYALVLVAILAGAWLLEAKEASGSRSWGNGLLAISLISVLAIAISAPWYIRNLLYLRNPFYPRSVVLFGKMIFQGPLDEQFFNTETLHFDFVRLFAYWRPLVEWLGAALPFLVVTPLLVLLLCYRRGCWKKEKGIYLWLVILPLLLLALYMQQPFSIHRRGANDWEVSPRYLLSFAACLHIPLGFLLGADPKFVRIGLPFVALAMLINLSLWTHFWWCLGIVALLAALPIRFLPKLSSLGVAHRPRRQRYGVAAGVLAFVFLVAALRWLDDFRERRKDDPDYGYIGWAGWASVCSYVRHNLSHQRLLCLGRPEKFPLYGRGYTNALYSQDTDNLFEFIRQQHINYVIGFRPIEDRRGSKGETWIFGPAPTKSLTEHYPGKFERVFVYEGAEVVKVLETTPW